MFFTTECAILSPSFWGVYDADRQRREWPGCRLRILVIEDNESIAELLRTLLLRRGHQVDVYIDVDLCPYREGAGCRCPATTTCADAIIVDYQLQKTTGTELLLRQEQAGCRVPSANKAITSALINAERKAEIEACGFTILRKPFEMKRLDAFLDQCEPQLTRDN